MPTTPRPTRPRRFVCLLIASVLAVPILVPTAPAGADFFPGAPSVPGTVLARSGVYDYGPSVIQDGNVQQFWWCSQDPATGNDGIFYSSYNFSTGQWSPVVQVLRATGGNSWQAAHVCDPSVVRGQFTISGQTYEYAMYYTATGSTECHGINNKVGVVFSHNGRVWFGQNASYNPVIRPRVEGFPCTDPEIQGAYGAGQTAVWNQNGIGRVTLFWTDTTADYVPGAGGYASRIMVATTTEPNGITFGPARRVSLASTLSNEPIAGLAHSYWNTDYAIDSSTGMIYSALPRHTGAGETYNVLLFRLHYLQVLAGTGSWEYLGVVDTNLTGLPSNFAPGFLRNGYGDLAPWLGSLGVELYFGGGGPTSEKVDLRWVVWRPTPNTVRLYRYSTAERDGQGGGHWTTTGYASPRYSRESIDLGYLELVPTSPSMVPLYGCQVGSFEEMTSDSTGKINDIRDRFVSLHSNCEGNATLGVNGYLYPSPPIGLSVIGLYRCNMGLDDNGLPLNDHFVSNLSNCEGRTVEHFLGYARSAS